MTISYVNIANDEVVEAYAVRRLFLPSVVSNLEAITQIELAAVGIKRIDFIESSTPEVEAWQAVTAGPVDKSEPSVWRTTWVVVNPTVDEAVALRKANIEQERDNLINASDATVTLDDGRVFQTDPVSVELMGKAKTNADLNGGFTEGAIWRAADNTNHPRTVELFAEISRKEEARCEPIWYISWALKEEVRAIAASTELTDDEKVTAIMTQTWAMPAAE